MIWNPPEHENFSHLDQIDFYQSLSNKNLKSALQYISGPIGLLFLCYILFYQQHRLIQYMTNLSYQKDSSVIKNDFISAAVFTTMNNTP